jgi:transcriptional regulator NrdR family protein
MTVFEKRAALPQVMKRDGRTEEFVPEKIVVSCIKCGAPAEVARQVAKDIQGKVREKADTADIRKMVLEELKKRNREWEQNWLLYDRAVKKRIQ